MDRKLLNAIAALLLANNIKVVNSDELHEITGSSVDLVIVDDIQDIEPCRSDYAWEPVPLPKPSKQKLNIKQAPRQSFRQSMRSVNRNR